MSLFQFKFSNLIHKSDNQLKIDFNPSGKTFKLCSVLSILIKTSDKLKFSNLNCTFWLIISDTAFSILSIVSSYCLTFEFNFISFAYDLLNKEVLIQLSIVYSLFGFLLNSKLSNKGLLFAIKLSMWCSILKIILIKFINKS